MLYLQRFTQYLASNNCTFNLTGFTDRSGTQGELLNFISISNDDMLLSRVPNCWCTVPCCGLYYMSVQGSALHQS